MNSLSFKKNIALFLKDSEVILEVITSKPNAHGKMKENFRSQANKKGNLYTFQN